jgi:vacuolar-type H+-ATPase subunit F/Vma7
MSGIRVIGDHEMVQGFSLLGVRDIVLATEKTAEDELRKAMDSEDSGMIILLDDFYANFSPRTKRRVETTAKPVVVLIPGKRGTSAQGSGNLAAMIKKAIGVELKIQ